MPPRPRTARGTVLVTVLFIVAILSVVAVTQMLVTRSEVAAAAAGRRGFQARAAAMSGVHCAIAVLLTQADQHQAWYDNPPVFEARVLAGEDDPDRGWRFTVFAADPEDPTRVRCGLVDEAGKLNINIATEEMLSALPNMTLEQVNCLLDYRDGDSEPRADGAEQDYYDSLPRPYLIKNGLLGTLEELLLVKGFDGAAVFGEDANRNGLLEPNEDDGADSFPDDDRDGQLNRGLSHLATAITYEPNVDSADQPRINLNGSDVNALTGDLREAGFAAETVDFIVAARKAGAKFADPSHLLAATMEVDDPQVEGKKMQISSGVNAGNLALVMDKLTCQSLRHPGTGQEILFGRVNLNTAPEEVLRTLPGLEQETVRQIMDLREGLGEQERQTTAWVYTAGAVSADAFKTVSPYVTARSFQYRVRAFGYNLRLGRFCVVEAVIDLAQGRPRISYLRELTHLGVPFVPPELEQ